MAGFAEGRATWGRPCEPIINSMARVIFLGTPEFAVPSLEAIVGGPNEVVAVYTQKDRPSGRGRRVLESPVKRRAGELGLEVRTPEFLKRDSALKEMASLEPDVGVVVAYGKLIPKDMLEVPTKGFLNLHPSLLPKYRGPSPIPAAILNGDEVTGVTVMVLDEGLDRGPILAQEEEPIEATDTGETLGERLAVRGAALMRGTVERWLADEVAPQPQENEAATLTNLVDREDGRIDWGQSAAEIWRQVRAFQPWPGSFTFWRGSRIEILEAVPTGTTGAKPGTVTEDKQQAVVVATGRGALAVAVLRPEGKRAMAAKAFVAGRKDFVGSRLPS